MPANTNPIFLAARRCWSLELDNADGTTKLDLVAAGTWGSLVESISVTTTDTSAVELDLFLEDALTNTYALGSVTIPAGAGTDGGTTAAVDLLNQTDLPWLRDELTIAIEADCVLQVAAHAAVTSAKIVSIVAWGGDY